MTKRRILIVALAIWILGAVYMAPKAINALRSDIIDTIDGRGGSDRFSLRGIIFPSLLLQDEDQE